MNKIFLNNIGDLGEAQRASFYRFLFKGISDELASFPNPFLARIKIPTRAKKRSLSCLVYLYTNEIKLKEPAHNIDTSLKRDLTYAIQLYIPAEYSYSFDSMLDKKIIIANEASLEKLSKKKVNKKGKAVLQIKEKEKIKKIRVKQDLFFGEIPLMTEEGTFIVSGCERIVISQIIRSPGVYFQKEFGTGVSRKAAYTATIISNKGLWTKFILDEKINADTKKSEGERLYVKLNDFKIKSGDSKEKKDESDEDKISIYDIVRYFGINLQEIYDSLKYPLQLHLQQLTRDNAVNEDEILFLMRKQFFNQRSGSFSIGEIGRYKVNKKLGLNLPRNITHLTSQDFIGIIDGLIELKYYDRISDDIDHIKNKQIRSVGELLQNQTRVGLYRLQKSLFDGLLAPNPKKISFEMEGSSDLSDSSDLRDEWIIDPRPLTSSIKEFFKTSQLSQFMDQVNPLAELTHKRRVSVFGPNGLMRDHISTVIRDIHPSQYGRLCPVETPEGQNAGLITSVSMFGRISSFGWVETPYFLKANSYIDARKQPIFLNPEQESETIVAFADISLNKKKEIDSTYLSVKDNYSFSVKEKKEVNFITTSPLQIISLATALIPFVEHDDANRALMGSNMQRQAVPLISPQKPIVGTGLESAAIIDSGMIMKAYSEGYVLDSSSNSILIEDLQKQQVKYYLRKHDRSNQETSLNQRPIVWPGEHIFSGQIIADGPSTNDGELALGRNLTIAYMPWEGYNYEDAIVINERIIFEDCLTSIHIEEHETSLSYSLLGSEKLTKNVPYLTGYIKRHLDNEGIVKVGSYVKEHDILVGKLTPCEEDTSAEAKLLKALYGKKKPSFRDTSLRVPHGLEGRVIDVRVISTNLLSKDDQSFPAFSEIIRIYIAQVRKIQIGDKLAGRHGNKGIISRVLPRQDMPYLPDGTPIDIIFNPLGVPSRMNVGQIFECLLGLAGENLGNRFKISPFDEIYGKEASRVLVNQKLKEASYKSNQNWIFNKYSPGKILLRDGRTGEYFDNPITVGKSYILKLIHLVEDKIHARATGPYSMITEQPLAGKSQKGGQRFGEMEVWALEAYGCSNTLQELLTIKSDDIDGRNDMYEAILVRREIKKPTPSIPESFLALIRELNALGLDFAMHKFENGFYSTTNIETIEKDLFNDLELRLKLRAILARKKVEYFAKMQASKMNQDMSIPDKFSAKNKILQKPKEKK